MKKSKILFIVLSLIFSTHVQGQTSAKEYETDYIVDLKGIRLNCKIVKIKNGKVKYRLFKRSQPFLKHMTYLKEIYIDENSEIHDNWENKINQPREGFSNVYVYSIYWPGAPLHYNGKKLVNVKVGRYFLHEIENGKEHVYYVKNNKEDEKIKLNPKNTNTYFIHSKLNGNDAQPIMGPSGQSIGGIKNGIILKLKQDKMSEYAIKSMSKQVILK
ncbi:MAG: hypothetical protein AAF039_18460 [Bacteroidota bacterium]